MRDVGRVTMQSKTSSWRWQCKSQYLGPSNVVAHLDCIAIDSTRRAIGGRILCSSVGKAFAELCCRATHTISSISWAGGLAIGQGRLTPAGDSK